MEKLIDPQQIAMADNRKIKLMGQQIEGLIRQLESVHRELRAIEDRLEVLVKARLETTNEQLGYHMGVMTEMEIRLNALEKCGVREIVETVIKERGLQLALERSAAFEEWNEVHMRHDVSVIVEDIIKQKGLRPPQKRGPKPKKAD